MGWVLFIVAMYVLFWVITARDERVKVRLAAEETERVKDATPLGLARKRYVEDAGMDVAEFERQVAIILRPEVYGKTYEPEHWTYRA